MTIRTYKLPTGQTLITIILSPPKNTASTVKALAIILWTMTLHFMIRRNIKVVIGMVVLGVVHDVQL